MPWFHDESCCEGYVCGLTKVGEDTWRELVASDPAGRVHWVQVACGCGWRSPRIRAPAAARWVPERVELSEFNRDQLRALWQAHAEGPRVHEHWLATRPARPRLS